MDFFDALLIHRKLSNFIFNSLIHACSFMSWFKVVVSRLVHLFGVIFVVISIWSIICLFSFLSVVQCTARKDFVHEYMYIEGLQNSGLCSVPLSRERYFCATLFHLKECPNLVALHVMHRILRTYWNVHPDGTLNFYFFNIC